MGFIYRETLLPHLKAKNWPWLTFGPLVEPYLNLAWFRTCRRLLSCHRLAIHHWLGSQVNLGVGFDLTVNFNLRDEVDLRVGVHLRADFDLRVSLLEPGCWLGSRPGPWVSFGSGLDLAVTRVAEWAWTWEPPWSLLGPNIEVNLGPFDCHLISQASCIETSIYVKVELRPIACNLTWKPIWA